MQSYLSLLNDILHHGIESTDRTGVGTISKFGTQLRFDLTKGFPAVTTKKLQFNAMKAELLWFIEGSCDERRLAEIQYGTRDESKTTIWTANANADYWKDRAQYHGDLGRIYGVQWRDWREYNSSSDSSFTSHDQLKSLIENIKNDPDSRRHMLLAYNPGELHKMALPPCHVMSQFYVRNGEISCQMYQRSCDVFLGLPFNIASYALLTHMIAQVCELTPKELIISIGDTHVYKDHIPAVKEQMKRAPYALPTLWLNPSVTNIEKFKMDDIRLINYNHHSAITAKMAV